jgi:hypothetical protein
MIMQEMNYGCGSTISAQDFQQSKVLYVGVGGGGVTTICLLFSSKGGVVGVDVVDEC